MIASSDASASVISTPQGGGALHGIGETFAPDLFTGTGNFTVPLALPNGRNGFQPKLSLVYSTGNGNGPFGLGWALSVPGVTRKTSHGLPSLDPSDTFLLSGAEDLVQVNVSPDGAVPDNTQTFYRPRTEGLFSKIEHVQDQTNSHDYWKVSTKDGLISYYGTPGAAGSVDPQGIIAHPDYRTKVFSWRLTQTADPFGNRIVYDYVRDRSVDGPHNWDQVYLKRVRYVDFENAGATQYLISVEFFYDFERADPLLASLAPAVKSRIDPFSEYRATFEIRTRYRSAFILVRTHPVGVAAIPVRAYRLIYLDERTDLPTDQLPANGASLLSRIEVIGYDDAGNPLSELPPLDFGYTKFDAAKRLFAAVPRRSESLPSLSDPDVELVDLHGGGLPDLVQVAGAVRYWRNLGEGKFGPGLMMSEAPMGVNLSDPEVQLLDMNGDGRADLQVTGRGVAAAFTLEFGPKWKGRPSNGRVAPTFTPQDPEVHLFDLNGDGVTDALRTGPRLECFFQDAHKGWSTVRTVARHAFNEFPDVSFSDPRVKISDMSGDGLQDIAFIHNGNVVYWPNLGRGDWGKAVVMNDAPRLPWGYDPERILLGDLDGDGLADLVYIDGDRVLVWFNQSGNGWSAQPLEICGIPPVVDGDVLRVIDLHGSGVAGILWSAGPQNPARQRMSYLDLAGGIKPYLLDQMSNNLGATTKVQYASSSRYFLDDNKCEATRWRTPLPFPVQVVARVEVIDDLSKGKLTTEYRYHNGYWDGAEREFRGFGRVDQYDSEGFADYHQGGLHGSQDTFEAVPTRFYSAPTLAKTWFHQGPIGDEYGTWAEQDYSGEYWDGDPSMLGHKVGVDDFLAGYCTAIYPHARRDMRDALRSLRGRMLRSEVYALDGSDLQDRPYTVVEYAYLPREEAPPTAAAQNRRRIFFPYLVAQRSTQWERGVDPMTNFTFAGDYDPFGHSCRQVTIACPRGWKATTDTPAQGYLATLALTTYARPAANSPYLYDRIARTRTYEFQSSANRTVDEVRTTAINSTSLKLIAESLSFYDRDTDPAAADYGAFVGLPFGRVGDFGALVRTETLALTHEVLQAAYGANVPPYLDPTATFTPDTDYPAAFVASLPRLAGYVYRAGGAGTNSSKGHFIVTVSRRYDFHTVTGTGRGLVTAQRDALANTTVVDYDAPYRFMPVSVTQPAATVNAQALTITAEYDYRTLEPKRVTDANQNVTDITFTAAGLVKEIWVKGKTNAAAGDIANIGDRREPSARFDYALRAYYDSVLVDPASPQPVYVGAVRRVNHDTDPDDTGGTIETRDYSDGYGRLLQTRMQGESVRFGNAQFGGGNTVLAADYASGAVNLITGAENGSLTQPNVTVSGWQRYDNKGRAVEKFEPFFDTGWDYDRPVAAQDGEKIEMYYDTRGQATRTVNPDGSERRVIYGEPKHLADPPLSPLDTTKFNPTPWVAYTYDANDNAGRTHAADSIGYSHHWNTPASIEIDALGRTVRAVARHRDTPGSAIEEHVTRLTYDIQRNLTEVRDALGRLAFQYVHDLAKRPLRTESIDAGQRRSVFNAMGSPVESRDAKGAISLTEYDALNRVIHLRARDTAGEVTLREKILYGDSVGAPNSKSDNQLGKLYSYHDEAGVVTIRSYDFKGNVLRSNRQVLSDDFMLSVINDPARVGWALDAPRVDWDAVVPPDLDAVGYDTSSAYDALNRVKWSEYPQCANGERYRLYPVYNHASGLESIAISGPLDANNHGISQVYIERIAYNAKGRRTLIAYGNGVMTRYAHDRQTFRLTRMRTERYVKQGATSYEAQPGLLQDIAYTYDLAGNILSIVDRTPGCGVRNNAEADKIADATLRQRTRDGDALLRRFEYDPLYRLVSGTGRTARALPFTIPWPDSELGGFNSGMHGTTDQDGATNATQAYRQQYTYDAGGNMLSLVHQQLIQIGGTAQWATQWTRKFGMGMMTPAQWMQAASAHLAGDWINGPGNQLTHFQNTSSGGPAPSNGQTHFYDGNGNMVREHTERNFEWDHRDRMKVFRVQTAASQPSCYAMYLYDAAGTRVKKLIWESVGNYHSTTYVGTTFEHHRRVTPRPDGTVENNNLHVTDDKQRIALVRIGDAFDGDGAGDYPVQYHLGDHLGSSAVVVSGDGTWINREEWFPYGETSFGTFGRKRYRFTGKEKDEESNLYLHGLRYYSSWVCRWTSCDSLGPGDGINLYPYCRCNPVMLVDPHGTDSDINGTPDAPTDDSLDAGIWQGRMSTGTDSSIYTAPGAGWGPSSDAGIRLGAAPVKGPSNINPTPDAGSDTSPDAGDERWTLRTPAFRVKGYHEEQGIQIEDFELMKDAAGNTLYDEFEVRRGYIVLMGDREHGHAAFVAGVRDSARGKSEISMDDLLFYESLPDSGPTKLGNPTHTQFPTTQGDVPVTDVIRPSMYGSYYLPGESRFVVTSKPYGFVAGDKSTMNCTEYVSAIINANGKKSRGNEAMFAGEPGEVPNYGTSTRDTASVPKRTGEPTKDVWIWRWLKHSGSVYFE